MSESSGFLRNATVLRTIRVLVLLFTLITLPLLFVYHDQMSKTYGTSADADPPMYPSLSTNSTINSASNSTSPSPSSTQPTITSQPTSLWSTMQTVDFIYFILIILTLFLHAHPTRPFFQGFQAVNLIVLIIFAHIWLILSTIWFTDLTWQDYDPHLYPISLSSNQSSSPTQTTSATPTATSLPGIPGVVGGYTLFPSSGKDPTIIKTMATPKATTTSIFPSATPTPTSAAAAAAASSTIREMQWASQCHTSLGTDTTPCSLMMGLHILGFIIGALMIMEGVISWMINMKEESVEQRLKRLQAKDDAEAVKIAKREKRVQREMQAQDLSRPVIQGPTIG